MLTGIGFVSINPKGLLFGLVGLLFRLVAARANFALFGGLLAARAFFAILAAFNRGRTALAVTDGFLWSVGGQGQCGSNDQDG